MGGGMTTVRSEVLPLTFVKAVHQVRPINQLYLQSLREKVRRYGVQPFPLRVTPDGTLFAGCHRYEAFKAEGIQECLMHVEMPPSLDKTAIDDNECSADALPLTFVDKAELIWRRIAEGETQQAIAAGLGWSRGRVSQFSMLADICDAAWQLIATTIRGVVAAGGDSDVAADATAVAFTEGLLRDITGLRPKQQMELVKELATGKIRKDKFKKLAENYSVRNSACRWVLAQIGRIGREYQKWVFEEVFSGRYDADWKNAKVGERKQKNPKTGKEEQVAVFGGPGPKLHQLVTAIRAEWEKKHSIVLYHDDFYEGVRRLGDSSVNAVITDPPYNISTDRVYRLSSQADWDKNFGEWDNKDEATFVSNMRIWAQEFFRLMKPGSSGFMFVGETYLNISQAVFDSAGFDIKGTFFWCRSNPGVSVSKADFMPAMDHAIQFVKPGETRTFNYPGEPDGFNWFRSPICSGNERLKDAKGNTLHPTQKPEAVIRHLMELISLPGDVVLDAFMGVGTTAAVAKKLGRKFVGFELERSFFDAAMARVEG